MINLMNWDEIDSLMMAGKLLEARQLLVQCPDGPEKKYRKLLLLRELEDQSAFEVCLKNALEQYPTDPRIRALEALFFHEAGELENALVAYKTALDLDHCQPSVWSNYGLALASSNDHPSAIGAFEVAISIDPKSELAWYNKGILHKKRREYGAALLAFQRLAEVSPQPDEALAFIGELYFLLGQMDAGFEVLQVRAERCDNDAERHRIISGLAVAQEAAVREEQASGWGGADANRKKGIVAKRIMETLEGFMGVPDSDPARQHLLDGVHGRTPPAPPTGYVEQLFDHYATSYEGHLSNVLQYQAPKLLADLSMAHQLAPRKILDLGCGTGLCGPLFTGAELVGVDCSSEMLKVAEKKNCYSQLVCQDLLIFLSELETSFELVLAADVLVYFGELGDFFGLAANSLTNGGCLLMSTEESQTSGYRLSYTGRYQHSQAYVLSCAEAHGLHLLEVQCAPLRKEEGEWIQGQVWAFCKPA